MHDEKTKLLLNSIASDYKSINNNTVESEKVKKDISKFEYKTINNLGILLNEVFKERYLINFENKILNFTTNFLVKLSKNILVFSIPFIILNLLKDKILMYNNTDLESEYLYFNLATSFVLFISSKIFAKLAINKHLVNSLYLADILKTTDDKIFLLNTKLDKDEYIEYEFLKYFTFKSFSKKYIFKTNILLENIDIDKLAYMFKKEYKEYLISIYKENKKLIMKTNDCQPTINEEQKQEYSFKDTSLDIDFRLYLALKDLNIYADIKETKENKLASLIYFNADVTYNSINTLIIELKHKLKKKNLTIETSDINEYDYMVKIIKDLKKINFYDYIEVVRDDLNEYILPVISGMNTQGTIDMIDFKDYVHMLIIGTTGSGKSNGLHNILCTLFLANKNVTYFVIDPKRTLRMYKDIDNVYYNDSSKIEDVIKILTLLEIEMNQRNEKFTKDDYFSDSIEKYNKNFNKHEQYIYLVIDEFSQLIDNCTNEEQKLIEDRIKKLAQLGRSAGFRIILASQKGDKETFNKKFKSNFDNILCYKTASIYDSINVLANKTAYDLKNAGDCIFKTSKDEKRYKTLFMSEKDHRKIISEIMEEQNKIKITKDN